MEQEQAEAIISDSSNHTQDEVDQAREVLDVVVPPPKLTLGDRVTLLARYAPSTREQGVYEELQVVLGEAKSRIAQIALKVEDDPMHLAHLLREVIDNL